MKKIFNIIKVGDYLYAVARNISYGATISIQEIDDKWWLMDGFLAYEPVVATGNPSLKGVLQLPPIEEDIYQLSREALPMQMNDDDKTKHRIEERRYGFQIGYKAAQAKGQYSEEDMHKMFAAGQAHYQDHKEPDFYETLKFLSKVPKYIEVEMEDVLDHMDMKVGEEPKSNNNIIVGRYIWD